MKPAAPSSISTAHMTLSKMGPSDDPEAFLDLFERTAEACEWQSTSWPVRLLPLLSGEAQKAAQQHPVQNLLLYADLKESILQTLCLGAAAPGLVSQMAVGWRKWRRGHPQQGGTGTVCLSSAEEDCQVGIIWPSNWSRTSWWRVPGLANPSHPTLSLPLSLSLPLYLNPFLSPGPIWRATEGRSPLEDGS